MEERTARLFWLIAKIEVGRVSVLTTDLAGGETALPVFGFEDEAQMFLELTRSHAGWWARQTSAGELVSVLLGPYAGVSRVLLDPLPGPDGRVLADSAGLVEMEREAFVEFLLDRQTRWPLLPVEVATASERRSRP